MEKTLHTSEHSFIRIIIFHGLIILCLLLTGCKTASAPAAVPLEQETEANSPDSETDPAAEEVTPTLPPVTLTPTPVPDTINIENDDVLAVEDAKAIVEQGLDLNIYTVSLLSDQVLVNDIGYYTFLVKQKNVVLEPVLAVKKTTGELFSFYNDGTLGDVSELNIYHANQDTVCDWNGDYFRYNNLQESDGEIHLSQGDATSFEFSIFAMYHLNIGELSGIARINGNTASYDDGNGFSLAFLMNDGELIITENGENVYAGFNVTFDGTYTLSEASVSSNKTITKEEAIQLLTTLTISQTGLPAEISMYTLTADDMLLDIKGTSCYSISVYSDLGDRMYLMNSYYVATDGSKIYRFDVDAEDDIEIYSAEE